MKKKNVNEKGSAAICITIAIMSIAFLGFFAPIALAWALICGGLFAACLGIQSFSDTYADYGFGWKFLVVGLLAAICGYAVRENQKVTRIEQTVISAIRTESWTERNGKYRSTHKGLAIVTPEGYLVRFEGPVVPACLQEGAPIRLAVTRWANGKEINDLKFEGCK